MNNSEYWKKRFIQVEQTAHQQGVQCYADIEKQYREAQRQIEGQIEAWYGRFADNNGITLSDARRLLSNRELAELKWDVQEYIQYAEENAINGQWVKQLENASARFHINRLEAIRLQMQQSLEVMFGNQIDMIDQTMQTIYKDGFYRTAFEVQKGVGVGWDFSTLDERQISKIINKPWAADGKNFSARIWQNRQKLVNELNTTLTQGIVLGQDPQKTIDTIARKMNTSKNNAGRLVMTEQAFFSETAQHDSFKELGVELYEIVATLDSHTSDICQDMDGKKFKMSEWEVGVTAPPFHVWCRSTTVPAFDDEFDLIGERVARGKDGKTYYVPSTMTYKQWQKTFVDGDKTGLQEVNSNAIIKREPTEMEQILQKLGVENNPIKPHQRPLNEKEIIERLSGGDLTKGSCSSLAFAYSGNKAGYDVLDFRDGESRYFFSQGSNIVKIAQLPKVKSIIVEEYSDFKAANNLLSLMEEGKEYYFAPGSHAAIVKKIDGKYQYLELQSAISNGWKDLTSDSLKRRFGCKKSHSIRLCGKSQRYKLKTVLIEIDSLSECEEFNALLGYLNTAVDKQRKGVGGNVK